MSLMILGILSYI